MAPPVSVRAADAAAGRGTAGRSAAGHGRLRRRVAVVAWPRPRCALAVADLDDHDAALDGAAVRAGAGDVPAGQSEATGVGVDLDLEAGALAARAGLVDRLLQSTFGMLTWSPYADLVGWAGVNWIAGLPFIASRSVS